MLNSIGMPAIFPCYTGNSSQILGNLIILIGNANSIKINVIDNSQSR